MVERTCDLPRTQGMARLALTTPFHARSAGPDWPAGLGRRGQKDSETIEWNLAVDNERGTLPQPVTPRPCSNLRVRHPLIGPDKDGWGRWGPANRGAPREPQGSHRLGSAPLGCRAKS